MRNSFSRLIELIGCLTLLISILIGILGYLYLHGFILAELKLNLLQDFYSNFSTELFSLAITILLINKLYENRATEEEKKRLILQMGSPDNTFALEAVRQLRLKGWLFDGSLQKADLSWANLENANLDDADLRGVNLYSANLRSASIQFCDLSGAYLPYADFSGATLQGTRFENTNLRNVKFMNAEMITNVDFSNADMMLTNFKGAWLLPNDWDWLTKDSLSVAKSLWGAILPNGKRYMGGYDLTGDVEEAQRVNIDILDVKLMKKFYRDGAGFQPIIDLPPGNAPHDNRVQKLVKRKSKRGLSIK